jgi:hypothetical protein
MTAPSDTTTAPSDPATAIATITLGVTDGIQEQLDGFEWEFGGYDLCVVTGSLKDIKLAVALLSARLEPQLSTLETIRIARDTAENATYLVVVLKETFQPVLIQLRQLLTEAAKEPFEVEESTHRIVPVTELPEDGDLVIPVDAMQYLQEPLVFDRLIITTEDETFYHTF